MATAVYLQGNRGRGDPSLHNMHNQRHPLFGGGQLVPLHEAHLFALKSTLLLVPNSDSEDNVAAQLTA